ncbi:hypothetical protein C6988_03565 [Nitrosopumilus sp. b1]|uniref:hypothetical protein n=1 Tax=Nitrosopumilus sp. b1 TaxID=2109907 RepID=UPI0015F4BEAE|nr:hypothetical protein [Nitrosopumilus sp. b1]KAF6243333.1 hypothetical protein C6988_03565 [Nitrosopumilus sp. b1]
MKIVDSTITNRVSGGPKNSTIIFSNGTLVQDEITIKSISLLQYIEKNDEKLGPYSLLTSLVETDIGSVELLYDEGYRGDTALTDAENFLKQNLGLSGLILRSIIALRDETKTDIES